jgi:hypothetical protein
MTLPGWIRPFHRALSLAFTALVLANFAGLAFGWQSAWLGAITLVPLFGLMATGVWLYLAPHLARRRP